MLSLGRLWRSPKTLRRFSGDVQTLEVRIIESSLMG